MSPLARGVLLGSLLGEVEKKEHSMAEHVQLLVADDDPLARSLVVASARETVGDIGVLEAEDGAEAIQLGLQQRPEIALLDVNMPRLGGIEAAMTLRELQPRMRLALHTGDPLVHRQRARDERLPLFGKLELDRTLAWLRTQAEWFTATREPREPRKRSLVCGACGYGILRPTPPGRCPMCHAESAWVDAPSLSPAASSA
jgi:CheY-like chemotaxis protein